MDHTWKKVLGAKFYFKFDYQHFSRSMSNLPNMIPMRCICSHIKMEQISGDVADWWVFKFGKVGKTKIQHWLSDCTWHEGSKILQQSLLWRHSGPDSVSNHQPHECLLNRPSRHRSKKTSKLRVTGLCAGNSPETGEFPAQMASNAENVSIWWRQHDNINILILELKYDAIVHYSDHNNKQ